MDDVDLNFRMMASGNAVPELRKAQNGVKNLSNQIDRSQAKMRGFNNGITTMQANTRKFAMGGLQQAGFQIGDYAVQVANGTSKMQAFGQQAPQFLQIFGPIGAIVGAGVAIFSAFAIAIQKTQKATEDLKGPVIDLSAAYSKLESIDMLKSSENLSAPAVAATQKYMALLDAIERVGEEQRAKAITGILGDIGPLERIAELKSDLELINEQIAVNRDSVQDTSAAQETLRDLQADTVKQIMAEVEVRNLILSSAGKTRKEAAQNLTATIEQLNAMGRMTPELRSQLVAYAEQAGLQSAIKADVEEVENAVRETTKSVNEQSDYYVGQDAIFRAMAIKQSNMLVLADKMKKSVEDRQQFLSDEDKVMSQLVLKSTVLAKNRSVMGGRGQDPRLFNYLDEYRKQLEQLSIELDEPGNTSVAKTKELAKTINRELSPEMKRLKTIQESVSSSFESGFMSIIDGTSSVKDAFKSMASEIIKELYRIFVVKKITGLISGAIGGFGSAAPTTSLRPVARPTSFSGGGYTGNGARSGGLDGKGGFMAMIHPRETVVDHTKGQGMGGVTVIQNNTFQSGVTRSEVSALLPKMVEASKAAVLDAKRQGGSYGKAFA